MSLKKDMVSHLRAKGMGIAVTLLITALFSPGLYGKPSLSAKPEPSVPWGANVTLQCGSEVRADTFHLHREGSRDPPQQLHLQDTAAPSQANFTISPVTWGHNGTYRCYSSNSSSPFLLSQPSDPLELLVSGEDPLPTPVSSWSVQDPVPQRNFRLDRVEGITEGGSA